MVFARLLSSTDYKNDDENDSDTILLHYSTSPLQEGFSGRNKEVGTTVSMRPVVTS